MLRRLELNNLAANICEEHWPEDFFVREVGCSQPAAGFRLVGLIAAVWTAIGNAYVHYKMEEVRHLYDEPKH